MTRATSTPSKALQAAQAKQAADDRANEALVIKSLMGTPTGRRWMWQVLSTAQAFADDGNLDPQHLAWKEGRRTVGLHLLGQVQTHCPAAYVQMTEEATGVQLTLLQEPQEEED
jgi:hypothetical protein